MKFHITYRYAFFILLLLAFSNAEAQQVFTLKQCIDTAIKKNLAVNQRRIQQEKNLVYWQQSKLDLLPSLNASIGQGLNLGRSIDPFTNSYTTQEINSTGVGISSGVALFNGLSLQSSIRQQALSWQASEQSLQEQKDNIMLTVILAYLQILTSEELLEQAYRQLEVSEEQLKRMQAMDAMGAIKPSDLTDVMGQYNSDEMAIINAKNNIKTNKINLCKILNIPYTNDFEIEKINTAVLPFETAESADYLYTTAINSLAQVKAVELQEKSARWGLKAQKGKLWPTLRFNANINTNYSSVAANSFLQYSEFRPSSEYVTIGGTEYNVFKQYNHYESARIPYFDQIKNNRYTTFSLGLQIPLFNSFVTRNNIRIAKLDLKERSMQTEAVKTALQLEVEQAWENRQASMSEYTVLLKQVRSYETSFEAAATRFNEGVGTSVDYLTAKNNLDRVNSNLIVTKYTLLLRSKILDYYEGKALW